MGLGVPKSLPCERGHGAGQRPRELTMVKGITFCFLVPPSMPRRKPHLMRCPFPVVVLSGCCCGRRCDILNPADGVPDVDAVVV